MLALSAESEYSITFNLKIQASRDACSPGLFFQTSQQFSQKLIDLVIFDPPDDDHKIVIGIDIDNIYAVAGVDERRCWRIGVELFIGIQEPIHKAVCRLNGSRCFCLPDKFE